MLAALHEVKYPAQANSKLHMLPPVPAHAPAFVKDVLGVMIANCGDDLPVSAMPCDGTFPTATTQYEKRSIAQDIPIWDPKICTQCGLCSLGCPHATIRLKAVDPALLAKAPAGFKTADYKGKEFPGWKFVVQVAPDDCTGCGLCVEVCPAKDKERVKHRAIDMEPKLAHLDQERANWGFFLSLPDADRAKVKADTIKGSQLLLPLFEFSGACAGCGETPYVKLLTQFFGDRMLIGNATGCSSIYGGNLPCTPYCQDAGGRGPAWSNSLFEDAGEFGFGFRLAIDQQVKYAHELLRRLSGQLGDELVAALINNKQETEEEIAAQRRGVAELNKRLASINSADAKALAASSDYLVRKSVWSFGGDGWAYDIGFGGLDHVFASGRDLNILVLDTEVYSNTGGQASKSTFRGAVAKFAAGGKPGGKKDLGLIAMSYGNVFVGSISLGANPMHAIRTILRRRVVPRHVALDRLLALHQLGHRHAAGHGHPEGRRGLRLLAALQFRPAERVAPVPTGEQAAGGVVQGFRLEGGPLRHPGPVQAAGFGPALGTRPAGHRPAVSFLRAVGRGGAGGGRGCRGRNRRQRRREIQRRGRWSRGDMTLARFQGRERRCEKGRRDSRELVFPSSLFLFMFFSTIFLRRT